MHILKTSLVNIRWTRAALAVLAIGLCSAYSVAAQETFAVTGTAIPTELLKLNYGPLPKGIQAYDLNICNMTETRQSLTSSQIYQALAESQHSIQPIGRDVMLAVILRNQNHSPKTWISLALTSTTSVLSVLGTAKGAISSGALSGAALGALVGQQLLSAWNPVLTADQVEKFEAQVLEPALVMDSGSCVERTVFTSTGTQAGSSKFPLPNFQFHVGSLAFQRATVTQ